MGLFQLHVAFEKKGKCMQSTFKIVLFESPCALSLTSLLSSCSPSCNQFKKKRKKEKNSHCLLGQTLGRRSLNSDKCNIKTKKQKTNNKNHLYFKVSVWIFGTLAERVCQKNCISQLRGQGCTSCNSCLAAGS